MPQSRKLVTMLVSLLAAVVMWLYVVTTVAPEATTRVSNIPINIDGTIVLEERGLVITEQDLQTLTIEVNTSRVNLSKLNADSIRVSADASKIREPGEYNLDCSVTFPDTVRSSDVDILRKSVDTVKITVSRLDTRSYPVELNWTGAVKEGYLFEAGSVIIDPAEVRLTGPVEELEQVKRVVVDYDISDLEQTEITTAELQFLDQEDAAVIFSEQIEISAQQVNLTLPVVRTKELQLKLELQAGGGVSVDNAKVSMEFDTIRVKGAAELVDALEDVLVVGSVDLSDIADHEEKVYQLNLPAGITNVSGETEVKVTIDVVGVSTDTISVSDIRLINVPEGLEADASTRTVQLTVRGDTEEIKSLKQSKDTGLYILVNLESYSQTGAFPVPGQVVNPLHADVSVPDNVEIVVVISNAEAPESDN